MDGEKKGVFGLYYWLVHEKVKAEIIKLPCWYI